MTYKTKEIEFQKYKTRGAYHWEQIGKHPLRRNAFVVGRYRNAITLLEGALGTSLKGKKFWMLDAETGHYHICWQEKGLLFRG